VEAKMVRYFVAVQGKRNLTCVSIGFMTMRDATECAFARRARGKRADSIKECSGRAWANVRAVYDVDEMLHEFGLTS